MQSPATSHNPVCQPSATLSPAHITLLFISQAPHYLQPTSHSSLSAKRLTISSPHHTHSLSAKRQTVSSPHHTPLCQPSATLSPAHITLLFVSQVPHHLQPTSHTLFISQAPHCLQPTSHSSLSAKRHTVSSPHHTPLCQPSATPSPAILYTLCQPSATPALTSL